MLTLQYAQKNTQGRMLQSFSTMELLYNLLYKYYLYINRSTLGNELSLFILFILLIEYNFILLYLLLMFWRAKTLQWLPTTMLLTNLGANLCVIRITWRKNHVLMLSYLSLLFAAHAFSANFVLVPAMFPTNAQLIG